MARARKCDRCGNLYEPKSSKLKSNMGGFNALKLIDMDLDNQYWDRGTKDLCPDCLWSFIDWFFMKEVPNEATDIN